MNIVIDARSYGARHFTGIGRYLAELLPALERADGTNAYTVVLCDLNAGDYRPTNPAFRTVVADARPYSLREQVVLPPLLRQLRPDLVHFPANFSPLAHRGARVTTVHDLTMLEHPPRAHDGWRGAVDAWRAHPARLAMWRGVRASVLVLANSETTAAAVRHRYRLPRSRTVVTYPGVSALGPGPGQRPAGVPGPPFLLTLGLPYPHKNLDRLLLAFARLHRLRPGLALVVAGRPTVAYEALRARAGELGLGAVTSWPGHVGDDELAWLYRHASLYVFPSLVEGFGLPGLEAMSMGTPVIAARASCLPEVYGDAAAYLDPHDEERMAADIDALLDDAPELERLARAGPSRAASYDWDRTARATIDAYRTAVEATAAAGSAGR